MKGSNRFEGLSKALWDCWEAEKSVPSGALSTLCTTFNQIYVQGRQYVTGKLFDQQTNGRRTRNAKDFWKGRAREERPQGHVAVDICTETFPVCPVVCRPICTAARLYRTTFSSNRQTETWSGQLRGTAIWEVSFAVPSFLKPYLAFKPSYGLKQEMCPTAMWTNYVANMIPITDNLCLSGNVLLFFFLNSGRKQCRSEGNFQAKRGKMAEHWQTKA